jgi:hypothetical protein
MTRTPSYITRSGDALGKRRHRWSTRTLSLDAIRCWTWTLTGRNYCGVQ